MLTQEQLQAIQESVANLEKPFCVLIDAGHGGNYPETGVYATFPWDGKRYTFKDASGKVVLDIREGVVNRTMAGKFKELCESVNLKTMDLHHAYLDRTNTSRAAMANEKDTQMRRLGGSTVLMSFHSNAFGMKPEGLGESPKGWSVWTTRGITRADALATIWYNKVRALFGNELAYRADLSDGDVDWEADFQILWSTQMPAVLAEQLFFTNLADAKLLLNEEVQDKFAEAAFLAVLEWLGIMV